MPFLSNTGPKTSLTTQETKSFFQTRFFKFPWRFYAFPTISPQCFLFHSRYDFCVDVNVEVKLEAEALLAGILQTADGAFIA